VGASGSVQCLLNVIDHVARSEAPVLILGESGVGKELVARAVHESGVRAKGSFIKVNCASLNENLLESELFGHVKGAFTGADRTRIGRFEAASGGSILLDEIGDVSLSMQVKLLRVLESKEIEKVGDHRPIPVDARIITATNKDLEDMVDKGLFRADLFYRINVVPIHVPPLRERKEDIPLLVQHFIDKTATRSARKIMGLSPQAMELMLAYDWPGNVRELRNVIEYAFVVCQDHLIETHHLAPRLRVSSRRGLCAPKYAPGDKQELGTPANEGYERLLSALRQARGSRSEAARILGVSRVTVWKRMKKYGLNVEWDLM
jgi:two-component system, NtrC family, response regulator HydG